MIRNLNFLIVLAAATFGASYQNTLKIYGRDAIKIKPGTPECVTKNCSPSTNASVLCSVGVCTSLENSTSVSQGVDIEDVYIERYKSTVDGQDKLALHITWSPIDNMSIINTKGFKIDITDGVRPTSSTCYHIKSTLRLYPNKKDKFHHNCFGKTGATAINPGSNLTVFITPLPLSQDGNSNTAEVRVAVPNCTNEDLHSLKSCYIPGGRPTSRKCSRENCTTFSIVSGDIHHIHCTTRHSAPTSTAYEKSCLDLSGNLTSNPSPPVVRSRERGQYWYKFIDPTSREVRVALNFTWGPKTDSSIKSLKAYKVSVRGPGGVLPTDKCFAIQTTDLTEFKHSMANFSYDCYGREHKTYPVEPSKAYNISINSIPFNGELLRFSIKIPSCATPEMQDVTQCIEGNDRLLFVNTDEVFCANRSLKLSYNVTKEYRGLVDVTFCESNTEDRNNCKVRLGSLNINAPSSGTIYDFSLPSNANLSINYTVYIHSEVGQIRRFTYPDFRVCVSNDSGLMIGLVVACVVVGLIIIVFFVWFCFFRDKCGFWIFKKLKPPRPEFHLSARFQPSEAEEIPVVLPGHAKVYVVFSDDHELHRNVVHWFCSFLQRDLGLTVKVHIWEENTAASSRPQYIINNLRNSDKVVVICSEGSNHCLNNKEAGNMYAPVVRQLCADSLAGKNPEKYVIAYFNYSSEEHIPEALRSHVDMYSSAFKLMDQLEKFYFRLLGVEQYQDGGILKINEIDDFFSPEKRSESALTLQDAMAKMTAITKINPAWYYDFHGVGNVIPDIPSHQYSQIPESLLGEQSITSEYEEGQPSITHLLASSPPQVVNGTTKGARPKIKNGIPKETNGVAHPHNPPQVAHQYHPPQQPHQNGHFMHPTQQIHANGGAVSYQVQNEVVEWTSPNRKPSEHASREPCEHDTSPTSADISFEISDSEDLSSVASKRIPNAPPPNNNPVKAQFNSEPSESMDSMIYNNGSYHPDSFKTSDFAVSNDFGNAYDSQVLTFLPSTSTQATDLDESDAPRLCEVDKLMNGPLVRKPSTSNSPESGLFTLAVIDEEEDLDLEDQIKSINLSANF